MTEFEKYVYETRKKEFFEMVLNKNIGIISRSSYKDIKLIIKFNQFGYEICGEFKPIGNVSMENIDYMAHLYASNQYDELKLFILSNIDINYLDDIYLTLY